MRRRRPRSAYTIYHDSSGGWVLTAQGEMTRIKGVGEGRANNIVLESERLGIY